MMRFGLRGKEGKKGTTVICEHWDGNRTHSFPRLKLRRVLSQFSLRNSDSEGFSHFCSLPFVRTNWFLMNVVIFELRDRNRTHSSEE